MMRELTSMLDGRAAHGTLVQSRPINLIRGGALGGGSAQQQGLLEPDRPPLTQESRILIQESSTQRKAARSPNRRRHQGDGIHIASRHTDAGELFLNA